MESAPRKSKPVILSRRNFLGGVGSTALLYAGLKYESNHKNETNNSSNESVEAIEKSENFDTFKTIFLNSWLLDREKVFFTSRITGEVIGPVAMRDFEVDRLRTNESGQTEPFKYLLTPAARKDEKHYAVSSIPREWFDYFENEIAKENKLDPEELDRHHVTADFVAAMRNDDEPLLQQGILNNTIRTPMDIARYFYDKPVRGAEDFSRLDYLVSHLEFNNPNLSPVMKEELKHLAACLCVKESKFNDDVESINRAGGIAQFIPSTVKGLGYNEYVKERQKMRRNDEGQMEPVVDDNEQPVMEEYVSSIPFTTQVEMIGKHFDNIYNELCSDDTAYLMEKHILPLFPDWDSFERDFVVPVMINAYNCGAGTMRVAIKKFIEAVTPEDLAKEYLGRGGKDIFFDLTQFARNSNVRYLDRYQGNSAAYPFNVYAIKDAFAVVGNKNFV